MTASPRTTETGAMPRLLLSATRKSSGKTTVALGLCAALALRGRAVRPFKKGPDYIDPMWLARAAGASCINLDFHVMPADELRAAFAHHARDDTGECVAVIEGNKGLFDGMNPDGSDSNAALAKLLGAPTLLILDARGMTRGAAAHVLGHQAFDPQLPLAGVILNRVGGARHESKLRAALERHTDVAVLGAVHADRALEIGERHLGLITAAEHAAAEEKIERIAAAIAAQVDLDAVESIADSADAFASVDASFAPRDDPRADLAIGIARDSAFSFYYADDLRAFAAHGARLIPFDTLRDDALPAVDGLYLGGGFPETHASALSANRAMRDAVKRFVERGGPVYAECGGLMYLSRRLTLTDGGAHDMAGAIPARVAMTERPVGRGYVRLVETGDGLWPARANAAASPTIPAHEFHYSKLEMRADDARFAYRVERGHGLDGCFDGLVHRNALASYSHLRHTAANPWVARFVAFVRACKAASSPTQSPPQSIRRAANA
ncbi:MAG: cobyrinate a,c-diamide synthase [bacterium]